MIKKTSAHHYIKMNLFSTMTTRYSCTYEVHLYIRGTATPARYSYTYEVQLHLRGTATPARYSYTCEVQLHPVFRIRIRLIRIQIPDPGLVKFIEKIIFSFYRKKITFPPCFCRFIMRQCYIITQSAKNFHSM